MTDSKLLDIVEDIKTLSTSGNEIKVEEYKNGKKVTPLITKKKKNKAMEKFQLGKGYNIGGRANLLEEMGRIDARRHPDRADRAEKRRVIRELNKGYKSGGAVLKGKKVGCQIK